MNVFGDCYDGLPEDGGLRRTLPEAGDSEYTHPVKLRPKGRLMAEQAKRRFFPWLAILLLLTTGRLLDSLVSLQLIGGGASAAQAESARTAPIVQLPPRGIFLDSAGAPLLKNVPDFSLAIIPADFPTKSVDRQARFKLLEAATGLNPEVFTEIEKNWVFKLEPVVLKEHIGREEALLLEEKISQIPGAAVLTTANRQYERLPGLGPILGYTGRVSETDLENHPDYGHSDDTGKAGLELQYETLLRGQPGQTEVEINARGQIKQVLTSTKPEAGRNVELYLERPLQEQVAAALRAAIDKAGAKAGAAVAIDPRTGGILASVSLPDYDNNLFARGITKDEYAALSQNESFPLLNRVTYGLYPSGSTIKPFVAAAALNEHVVSPNQRLQTPETISVGQWTFRDWKFHGSADVYQAVAESNNVYFYTVGGGYGNIQGLGVDRIDKYLESFGFGRKTGVDYGPEQAGTVPSPAWKQKTKKESWYIGDTYNLSIGQGDLLVTPLQLARGIAAIANGGRLIEPRYARALTGGGQRQEIEAKTDNPQVVPPEVVKVIKDAMRRTVEAGSARPLQAVGVPVAAKTGTAQFTATDKSKTHAWTVAYAPADNPEMVLAVIVEGGGESFDVALPVIKDVFTWKWPKR